MPKLKLKNDLLAFLLVFFTKAAKRKFSQVGGLVDCDVAPRDLAAELTLSVFKKLESGEFFTDYKPRTKRTEEEQEKLKEPKTPLEQFLCFVRSLVYRLTHRALDLLETQKKSDFLDGYGTGEDGHPEEPVFSFRTMDTYGRSLVGADDASDSRRLELLSRSDVEFSVDAAGVHHATVRNRKGEIVPITQYVKDQLRLAELEEMLQHQCGVPAHHAREMAKAIYPFIEILIQLSKLSYPKTWAKAVVLTKVNKIRQVEHDRPKSSRISAIGCLRRLWSLEAN